MNTLKTAVVVVLLLVVLYGVYTTLNTPPKPVPADVAVAMQEWQPVNVEMTGIPAPGETGKPGPGPAMPPPALQAPPLNPPIEPSSTTAPPLATIGAPPAGVQVPPLVTSIPAATPAPAAGGSSAPNGTAVARLTPDQPPVSPTAPASGTGTYPSTGRDPVDSTLNLGARGVEMAWREAQAQLNKGKLAEALKTLSPWYRSPDLKGEQSQALLQLLDQLAGSVIYSTDPFLEPTYVARKGETLEQIAEAYQVPVQLLGNINSLRAPYPLVPGQQLKVVRGPFRAEVDLAAPQQLTLFAGDYYAGRFDVTVGNGPAPTPGTFTVLQKEVNRPYFSPEGQTVPAGAPNNPYGATWLGLENQLAIHATGSGADSMAKGCIGLNPKDAADVFGILSVGSRITIRK